MLFYTGLTTGIRVSDIVKLNVDDVREPNGVMKLHITIIEKKTKKVKRFPLCNGLRIEMEKYIKNMKQGEYLFKSRNGENKPITTTQAYRIIKRAGNKLGLKEAVLQTIYNHSSGPITLKYIGISQDEIDTSYENFSI